MIDSPLALLLVLALLAALPLLLRRYRAKLPDGLRVVSRTALSRNAVVAVVAVGEQRLLVGAGEHGVQLLGDVTGTTDGHTTDGHTTDDHTTGAGAPHPPAAGRTDAASATSGGAFDEQLAALVGATPAGAPTAGPGIGLVDRLRAMTVRTPVHGGRPAHVPRLHR